MLIKPLMQQTVYKYNLTAPANSCLGGTKHDAHKIITLIRDQIYQTGTIKLHYM